MPSYYEILGCENFAPYEVVKQAYHDLALQYHPDKAGKLEAADRDKFLSITEAWQALRDSETKRDYDTKLKQGFFDEEILLYATITLGEMTLNKPLGTYSYLCRCGGLYLLSSSDIKPLEELIIECEECSFNIKIVWN